jgi:dUTP pyrophosphatase
MTTLQYFKINQSAVPPVYSTDQSACFDLSVCLTDGEKLTTFNEFNESTNTSNVVNGKVTLYPGDRVLLPTGMIFEIPQGHSLRMHPRSGLSLKKGIVLANCEAVIDSDYVDQSYIMVHNMSMKEFVVSHGDRIAQGEVVKDEKVTIAETTIVPIKKTNRTGGLGSTGLAGKGN